ncbi:MAG: DUF3137 domain-containing protein [Candidatus Acidulodesulfobacterium sp.]
MSDTENFDKFIEETIFPELEPLEKTRQQKVNIFWIIIACIVSIDIIVFAITQSIFSTIFSLIISLAIIGITKNALFKKYDTEFSSHAIGNITKFIDKNLIYNRNGHISPEEYKASRLFLKSYDGFIGRDLVTGKLDKTQVKFSYLYTYYEEESEDSDGHKTTHRYTIFDGLFFIADFNKKFSGEVYLFPHGFRFFSPRKGTNKILLENPEFNSIFDVYGSDPVVSMYAISTSLMDRLLNFKKKTNSKINMSLINSTLYLAVSGYKPFKVPIFDTVYNKNLYYGYLGQLKFATGIVDEFNLNTRIWG